MQVANSLLRYCSRLEKCLDDMRESYYGRRDLPALCQALSDFAGNPVVAYDASLLPAAQSCIPKDVALNMFGSERADYDFVMRTVPDWKRKEGEAVFLRKGARRISDYTQRQLTAACNIVAEGEFRGYIELFEVNKPVSDGEMVLLEQAADILAASPYSLEEDGFIQGHLKGRPTQEDITASWLSALRWNAGDGMYVLAIYSPKAQNDSRLYLDHIVRMLHLVLPDSVNQQMGEMPVVVANERLTPRKKALEDVAALLEKVGERACVGASEIMDGIGSLHEAYEHARFSARFAFESGSQDVMRFEECWFPFFVEWCDLKGNRSLIIDARASHMFADDRAAGSENASTVKAYIETGFNLNATAQRMSIHRNTVAYRLKHVQERYGIDLSAPIEDPLLVFRILLSCKLLLGDA